MDKVPKKYEGLDGTEIAISESQERMAVVVENIDEVKEFLEEEGMDIQGMSDEELEEAAEVFPIPDGRYLIVEG